MKPIYDKVYVEVTGIYDDELTITGSSGEPIKLFKPINNWEDNPDTQHKITSGKVHYICQRKKKNLSNAVYNITEPFPASLEQHFNSTVHEPVVEVKEGDKVYFHYNALTEETRHEKLANGNEIHVIDYFTIFCFVRAEEIIPVSGYALIQQMYEDEVEEIEIDGVKRLVTASKTGIILDINPKSAKRKGVLRYIGKPLGPESRTDAKIGDVVLLAKNKDWENTIEGGKYYVTKQNGMFAKEVDGEFVPYGDYLLVEPLFNKSLSIHLVDPQSMMRESGIVKAIGPLVGSDIQVGDVVHYKTVEYNTFYDKESNRLLIKNALVYGSGDCNVKIKNNKPFFIDL